MDWNGNLRVPFLSRQDNSLSFLYNYNYDLFPGLEMKHTLQTQHATLPTLDKNMTNYANQDMKKKRLTNEQLDSLENSFQEEIKLDPDRKMKLAKELGLAPRQIAVWFQNRRARWKTKQLERLYDVLKQEYDAVSKEKQKLQEEVLALRAVLKEQVNRKQVSTAYMEVSGEETVESTSIPSSDKARPPSIHQMAECDYVLNIDDFNPVLPPYLAAMPSCP